MGFSLAFDGCTVFTEKDFKTRVAKCKQPVLGTADTGSHDDVILCGLLQQYMKMHIDAMDSRGGV